MAVVVVCMAQGVKCNAFFGLNVGLGRGRGAGTTSGFNKVYNVIDLAVLRSLAQRRRELEVVSCEESLPGRMDTFGVLLPHLELHFDVVGV
jgi:hypothetical protein